MDRKQKIKSFFGCVMTLGITIMLLRYSTDLMERKYSDEKHEDFFEQEEDFDVLFLGTSHVMNGIFPMELWRDYGIVSYNFGGRGNMIATSYWVMKNALDYTSPQLMVIDCYYLSEPDKFAPLFSRVHDDFDAFPLSKTKIQTVYDLFDGKMEIEEIAEENKTISRNCMEIIWNYAIYHTRWSELCEDDFQPKSNEEKGADSCIAVWEPKEIVKIPTASKMEGDTVSVTYLKKIIEECQEQGIDVLLIYLPFAAGEKDQRDANRVYDIAKEYDVNYINFLDLDIVKYETDYFDSGHLNSSGSRKVTDYIGRYIEEHYDLSDRREDDSYHGWYTDYADYVVKKINDFQTQESLDNYLMLLADKNFSAVMEINNPVLYSSDSYIHLLDNLGINSSELTENTDFIVIEEVGRQAESFENFHKFNNSEMTALGEFSLFTAEDGTYGMYLDNKEFYAIDSEQNTDVDVRITVIDRETKEIVDQSTFTESQIFRKN